jgi:dihydrofolate synthase/folylpolyglutamate synthase
VHAIFGALADKDYGSAYEALKSRIDHWYLCDLEGERGQSAAALSEKLFASPPLSGDQLNIGLYASAEQAFSEAKLQVGDEDLLLIFGSFYLVGAIIPILDN